MLGAILATSEMGPIEQPHLQRLHSALQAHVERVVFYDNRGEHEFEHRELPSGGVLAALAATFQDAGDDHVVLVAADIMHPSAELLRYMIQVRGSHEAVVPERRDGRLQPLLALYHPRCARRAEGLIAAGQHRLDALLEVIRVRRVTADEVAKFGDPDSLLARAPAPQSFM
ncbi:MAG: NTP transferase domain-containing protein [Armatimonadota bacterium]|nr:NTP transferase domain-containing protein [Armatimonadota bacterium]